MNIFDSSRAQDVVAVVLGVITALSPIWVATNTAAMWSLIVLGVLIALSGLVQLLSPEISMAPIAMGVFGVLLFISPWVMNFDTFSGAAWTAWIIGVLTVVVALGALPAIAGMTHGRPVTR